MTRLAALQSLIEFSNSDLFTKVLLDRGIDGTLTYTAADEMDIDLCLAEVCLRLSVHPDITDGNTSIKYTPESLLAMRSRLYDKWGLTPPEGSGPAIQGKTPDGTDWW